jgi:hypothetical protein
MGFCLGNASGRCGIRWLVGSLGQRWWTMRHPMVGWFLWAALVDDAASDGWLVPLDSAGGRCGIRWLVGSLGRGWWTMRHARLVGSLGQRWWTMHPTIDDARTALKFAASGRQKGAPGDSPVFRIIIRLENAGELVGCCQGAVSPKALSTHETLFRSQLLELS